jgi:YfiH family protein
MAFVPELCAVTQNGVGFLIDEGARDAGLLVAFGNRRGGVSRPPFEGLNLALRVGDDRDDVIENRRRAASGAGFDGSALALARQVHGRGVIDVSPGQTGVVGIADVLLTRRPGPVLGVLTADCAPVVLAGARGVAIVHAGWRGLVAGAVETGIDQVGPVRAAWVGPCIHDCCYEVGPEVIEAFSGRDLPTGSGRVDPARAAEHVLRRSGVDAISVASECTHCESDYFSFRRDGLTGRQGAFAGLLSDREGASA